LERVLEGLGRAWKAWKLGAQKDIRVSWDIKVLSQLSWGRSDASNFM
jgi:hypothetical protein